MSNTIITNYSDVSGKNPKTGNQLVVFANKDGTYTVEKAVLDSLLEEPSYENTSISVVHINEDGKPEDASDHSSDDESIPHINLTVNSFYNTDGMEPSLDENDCKYDGISKEAFMLSFQNDHCYTPYTSENHSESESLYPDEENVSAIVNKSTIPSSKKITILENKIIAKGKNLLPLNATESRVVLKGTDIIKKSALSSNITPIVNINRNIQLENRALLLGKNRVKLPEHTKDRSSSESLHDEDRDSDSDYRNLSKKKLFGKNFKPKSLINKNVKRLLNKKLESKRTSMPKNALSEIDMEKITKPTKIKTFSKLNNSRRNPKKLIAPQELLKSPEISSALAIDDPYFSIKNSKDKLKLELKPDIPKTPKSVPKKDKKLTPHLSAVLLNDMTTLFSTPDVLRKNSTDSKQTPKILEKNPVGLSKRPSLDTGGELEPVSYEKMNVDSLKISKTKHETKTYSNSSKTHSKNVKDNTLSRQRETKISGKTLDLMSPLDDETLTRLLQETNSEILAPSPNTPIDFESSLLPNIIKKNSAPESPCLSAGPSVSGITHAPLSLGLDLLAGLQPEEEGLTEDLLMHVAQLVQSSENLQEVIDKQVLGKVGDVDTSKEILPLNPTVKMELLNNQFNKTDLAASPSSIPRKEPIQIIRSNGRIITLPPIEAPATRSSKRKSLLNTSLSEPAPAVPDPSLNKLTTPATQAVMIKRAAQQPPAKKTVKLLVPPDRPAVVSQLTAAVPTSKDDDDAIESDESWNSEDDPDRLWCICKQPHNNRFMICCDLCEDWFHGKCVNITKSMGQEMEEKGVEWRCPNCLKKKAMAKNVLKMNTPRKSTENKTDDQILDDTFSHLPADPVLKAQPGSTFCIVCKKAARASSIYCSDACILKHAQESLGSAASPSNANLKSSATKEEPSEKQKPVIVYERKTGRCLAGPSAPTEANLKVWLQQHPTFEVIHPGKNNINKMKPKVQSVLKINNDKHIIIMQPPAKNPAIPSKTPLKVVKPPAVSPKTPTVKQAPVKPVIKSPLTPKSVTQPKLPAIKSPTATTPTVKKEEFRFRSSSTEPIRENVKKTLQEQLSLRMSESKDSKFTQEEIVKFAVDTEVELHNLFRDVGAKYKAKYRSLMFNLKDRKNLSLWQKICDRSLTPKQLVRLSPEELASQELAQWRDKEAKHQLELIKKSELDLLSCSKTYVLKTHKGEEVMESRTTDTTELDPNVAVEDLVSALNNSGVGQDETVNSASRSASPSPNKHKHDQKHSSHHKHSKHKNKQHYKSSKSSHRRDHSSSRSKKTSTRHVSSSRDSKSHSHRRKSSKDEKSETEKSRRTSSSSHSHSHSSSRRSKSKSRRKESPDKKNQNQSDSGDISKTRSLSKEFEKNNLTHKEESKHRSSSKESDKKNKSSKENQPKVEIATKEVLQYANSITDPIKSFDDVLSNDPVPMKEFKITDEPFLTDIKSPPTPGTPEISSEQKFLGAESDQEPTSTVDSTLSAIWNGSVSMVDVAKFNVTAYEVSGQCEDITPELGNELEIVGRISPEIVWDYINKMKKQGSKDIVVIKLSAANDEEKTQYNVFFSYLNSRNRLGVVKVSGTGVKDFYILPLSSHSPLPSVLLPLHGPGFEEARPHLLLGVIVRQRRKRPSQSTPYVPIPAKISKTLEETDRSYTPPPDGSYTPPSTPKRMPLPSATPAFTPTLSSTVKDKIAASLACAEDDEPYSPGGSDSNSVDCSSSPPLPPLPPLPPTPRHSTDLQRKMEELNRKIEEQKKQIQNMAVNISSNESLDEPYSPSGPTSPSAAEAPLAVLSSISLPSNLQEILASIKSQVKPAADIDEGYVPTAVSVNPDASAYYRDRGSADVDMRVPPQAFLPLPPCTPALRLTDSTSKLSKLSEAELLSMVPDEELLLPSVYPPLPSLPPPPPLLDATPSEVTEIHLPPPPSKKKKLDPSQPPPPGMEDDD